MKIHGYRREITGIKDCLYCAQICEIRGAVKRIYTVPVTDRKQQPQRTQNQNECACDNF